MKKATRMLVLAASLTLLLALVSTANAAPGKCNPKKDPGCSPTTTVVVPGSLGVGLSCAEYATLNPGSVVPLIWDVDMDGTFPDFDLTSRDNATCIDISTTTPGSFTVEVTPATPPPKGKSSLHALIKDSHPGDHCGTVEEGPGSALNLNLKNETTGTIDNEITGTIDDVPAAATDACGTGYADTTAPLAFMLELTGRRGITAEITLTYEDGDS
jgi:hypothetical protein